MTKVVKRTFRYRFYPTANQAALLNRTFGCVRYVYNRGLDERSRAWTQEQRRVGYVDTAKMLTTWKQDAETEWLSEVSNVPLQQTLRHLQGAFVNFWEKRAAYPRYKRRKSQQSATFTKAAFSYRDGRVKLAKMATPLDIRWSRPLPDGADPSSVTVSRDAAGRWHISILCEDVIVSHPAVTSTVGIDAGVTRLLTLSTGEKITNPKHEKRDRARLVTAHRSLSRKQLGSNNREKSRRRLAKINAKIADRRRDTLHKLSTRLIRENQVIAIEDLSIRNMMGNRRLARAIADASWSELRRQLEYKAEWHGRTVVAIDRFYPSSKTCSTCGFITAALPLTVREWTCANCGVIHDRDVNAARNIRAAGLAVLACGDGVRPPRS